MDGKNDFRNRIQTPSGPSSSLVEFYKRAMKESSLLKRNDDETLLVFGYTCKLYRDDEKSKWINSGQHLIPWMGDQVLLIDRYDVRGYLNDLSEFHLNNTKCSNNNLTDEEQEIENILNLERFRDLDVSKSDDFQEKFNADENSGQYSKVAYSYDSDKNENKMPEETDTENVFKIPYGLNVPENMILPTSMKHHAIIEKTAEFVVQHGLQMEILLKTKQSGNTNFEFLSIDSELNPYYKHLSMEIKHGRYVPNQKPPTIQKNDSGDDSESDDDYLHPSLLSSNQNKSSEPKLIQNDFKIPNIFNDKQQKNNSSYSQLVKNFKDKFAQDIESDDDSKCTDEKHEKNVPETDSKSNHVIDVSSLIPKPPPELDIIINKLAEHVGQNGESFENSIKALNDRKFDFLNNGHKYHAYYVKRKIHFINQFKLEKQTKKNIKKDNSNDKKSIAFSLNPKRENCKVKLKNNLSVQEDLQENQDEIDESEITTSSNSGIHSKEKELQEIRKRKASEFLKMLKREKRLAEVINPSRAIIGPELPKPKTDIRLSPTIEIVTSPPNSPINQQDNDDNSSSRISSDPDILNHSPSPFESEMANSSEIDKSYSKRFPDRKIDIKNSLPKRYRDRSPSSSPSRSNHHRRRRRSTERQRRSSDSRSKKNKRSRKRKHKASKKDSINDSDEDHSDGSNRSRERNRKGSSRHRASSSSQSSSRSSSFDSYRSSKRHR